MRLMYAYGTRSTVAILRIPRRVTELRLKLGTTGFVCELPLVTKMQRARLSKFTAACEEHGADFEIVEADGVASTLRLRLIASEGAEEAM